MADVRRILDNMTRQGATMEGRMLAPRFEYDGKPIVSLNSLQVQAKAESNRKIAAEIISSIKFLVCSADLRISNLWPKRTAMVCGCRSSSVPSAGWFKRTLG